MSVQYSHLYW